MGDTASALSLLGDTIEQVRAQRVALADLRQQLEGGDRGDSASDTLVVLGRCLASETYEHERTLWAVCRLLMASDCPSLAPFVRRLHAQHEDFLGLLGFAVRVTADFLGADDASGSRRALLASLGMWAGGLRTVLRSERDRLLPAVLALDPMLAPEATPTELTVARHDTLSTSGIVSEMRVFCPGEGRSVALDWCATCPAARHVTDEEVVCTPGGRACEFRRDEPRSGATAFVGEALPRRHLSVQRDVPAGRIAAAFEGVSASAVAVVDEASRLVRVVAAETVFSAPATTPAEELRGDGASIGESDTLADAIARMVRTHGRFVAVTDEEEQVVGVLRDLDVLRWVARHRSDEGGP